ncbi:mediator of RNA polymerase II transcription subunit 12-like protein isoform X2 [Lepeophtheirus salmonis]|uniref:mediator of RNA polymerase II transcription subunit 12-like protein isoform X2 n=1 Tax=Lepeophtheirus salmonis TaxID=72036 RepID=UPI001AE31C3A|nr:mediator of RNA polymerase II transcription subunit 12-like isoform X2 [Lepeophtheirus salmonis]
MRGRISSMDSEPKKFLRKPRLGLPDIYPQDVRQKEDELSGINLKQGFSLSYSSLVTDEYGSASSKVGGSILRVGSDFKTIVKRKIDLNTFPCVSSKRQPLNTKDNFTLVTAKTARKADLWFKDLWSGVKSLSLLSKKVPILNKREEIISSLMGVPVRRAVWLIKMTAAYHTSMSETNKTKKRIFLPDPGLEWTQALTKFMREQLNDISADTSLELSMKQWTYACELSEYMYNEGLLDRQEFLQWILDLLEKSRYHDEPQFKLTIPLVLQYLKEFTLSEVLCRKLAFQSAKKIAQLLNDTDVGNGGKELLFSPTTNTSSAETAISRPLAANFVELLNDPLNRFSILSLSTILQVIVVDCPTSLVWNYFGDNKTPSCLLGSPLDLLPGVMPSVLPMPPGPNNSTTRQLIRQSEVLIKDRSTAVEVRWSTGGRGSYHSKTSNNISATLSILEDLDSYCFEKMDSASNTLESLYSRLFKGSECRDLEDPIIVHTLCTWAVTSKRSGDHRAFVVAKILEQKQIELLSRDNEEHNIDADSSMVENSIHEDNNYLFQSQLLYYLDNDAPTMSSNKQEFSNLILLFYELIAHDVFSHDQYMCTLISRGDLNNPLVDNSFSKSIKEDGEERKINEDITSIVNEIKVGNQLGEASINKELDASLYSRHWQYTYHFPLPQDDSYIHDCNQRHVLLYGAGKVKDDAARNCKKLSKELLKLFSKKLSIDVSDGGKAKKQAKSEFLFESVTQKFQSLSYYDQHSISHQCGQTIVETLSVFCNLNGSYLPISDYVLFLFDLAGLSLNIQGLLDWCLLILKELPGVENQLIERSSYLIRIYSTTLALYIVSVLRRYHSIFILNPSDVTTVFDYLCKIVFRTKISDGPTERKSFIDYNSAEWCILAYLYDLSCNYSLFKNRDRFQDLKRLFSVSMDPSEATYSLTDRRFGFEFISNPRKKIDSTVKQMENPKNRYNFVCNVIIEVCECNDTEKLNDLAILCCEFTAQCHFLSSEWLGALTSLCNAGASNAYADLLHSVNIRDPSIYNRIGIFISILIARYCFQLQSFVISVAIPSLLKAWDDVKDNSPTKNESEIGARVSCHLLLRLFKGIEPFQPMYYTMGSPQPMPRPSTHASGIRCSSDRHLLAAAHRNITVGAIIAVLKAIMVLGDANSSSTQITSDNCSDFGLGPIGLASRTENANLSDFAKYTLRQICLQQWVYDRCFQVPDDLLRNGTLLDPMLSSKQAQTLLRLICSGSGSSYFAGTESPRKSIVTILNNLDEWNLRVSIVDIKLTYHQLTQIGSSDLSDWLDNVARAIVDVFQYSDNIKDELNPPEPKKIKICENRKNVKYCSIWMVPYLVKHLKFLQNRVLKVAVEFLEVGGIYGRLSWSKPYKGYMPLLGLILTCIRELDSESKDKKDRIDREELKDNLLSSLHSQLSSFLSSGKGIYLNGFDDIDARKIVQDALMLRFSLVGGLFDTIMSSNNSVNEWSSLLSQLIARGVIDLTNNADIFTNALDMLTVLVHSTLVSDREANNIDKTGDDTRKYGQYNTLVKKLKREIGDRSSPSIVYLKQLLPIPKVPCDVIISEQFGYVSDSKGNKVKGLHSDKKHGLQAFDKHKISPWDILEAHKNPAPLSWSWFTAVKHERKKLRYLNAFLELKYANNQSVDKSNSYFTVEPPLPVENLEPSTRELKGEMEAENKSSSNSQSYSHPMVINQNQKNSISQSENSGSIHMLSSQSNMAFFSNSVSNVNSSYSGQINGISNHQSSNISVGSSQMRLPLTGPRHLVSQQHQVIMQQRAQQSHMRSRQMLVPSNRAIPHVNGVSYSQPHHSQIGNSTSWGGGSYSHASHMYGNNFSNSLSGGARYQGKQALQNMLRAKHPTPPASYLSPSSNQYHSQTPQYRTQNSSGIANGSSAIYQNPNLIPTSNSSSYNTINQQYNANNFNGINQGQYLVRNNTNYQPQQLLRRPVTHANSGYLRNSYGNMQGNYRNNIGTSNAQLMSHVQQHQPSQIGFPHQQQNMF